MKAIHRSVFALMVSACLWWAAARPAAAQTSPTIREMIRREMRLEEETRKELEPTKASRQGVLFDYGGFARTTVGRFDSSQNGKRMARTFRALDLRLWTSATLAEIHRFYFRLRTDVIDWNSHQDFEGSKFMRGPNVDQLFYSVDLDEWAARQWGEDWPMKLRMTVGRQYMYIGSGMTYNLVADGIQFEAQSGNWDLKVLGSRTIGRTKNIDRSPTVGDNERYFAGMELAYAGIPRHRPYAYVLIQHDESDERWPAMSLDGVPIEQDFNYHSQYFGIGSTGEIVRNLGYRIEGVLETGRSHGDVSLSTIDEASSETDRIRAYAFNAGLDYYWPHKMKPRVSLDYFFASGDKHRERPTDTVFGNRCGTTDRGFIGFGYVDTGYALSPEFSNIQFIRLDGSFRPLPDAAPFKELEWGATYFLFRTPGSRGGISDPLAERRDRDLGQEIDTYINWRVLSDVSLSLRYGVFFPGDAYRIQEAAQFMLATLTYSF